MLKKMTGALLGVAIASALGTAQAEDIKKVDVLLIGGGIMSSTLGIWLNELEPNWTMEMVEAWTRSPTRAPTAGTTLVPATPPWPS